MEHLTLNNLLLTCFMLSFPLSFRIICYCYFDWLLPTSLFFCGEMKAFDIMTM